MFAVYHESGRKKLWMLVYNLPPDWYDAEYFNSPDEAKAAAKQILTEWLNKAGLQGKL